MVITVKDMLAQGIPVPTRDIEDVLSEQGYSHNAISYFKLQLQLYKCEDEAEENRILDDMEALYEYLSDEERSNARTVYQCLKS